jgi:hypothetical protein
MEFTLKLLAELIAKRHDITEDKAKDIIRFALGTDYVFRHIDDKVGRLIEEGYFERIH